ncbi:MAG TPA: peptidoglycan-associated lipoprotein Pal [Sphingomicrobium sp.]|jgi:peptidoglycan-associated lipoprotein|nr:peptidoglycan-associated lipoprotein Pal [Sphingomicrobium sp.]
MRKSLTIGVAVLAIAATSCARRAPVVDPIPPGPTENIPPAQEVNPVTGDVEPIELPAAQADLVAKAGSDTVYFGTDEYNLDDASRATLAAQARWLLANPNVRASIEGHADERGTREYNLALGERRANAARDFLVQQGVPLARLLTVSWGKERPVAQGSNEQAWAQNRRAVTVVVR